MIKKTFLVVLFSLFFITPVFSYWQHQEVQSRAVTLDVGFRTGKYTLTVKFVAKDRRQRIFAVSDKREVLITKPQELIVLIPKIRTKKEALNFVRLFTDGYTHKLFLKPAALEIFVANKKNIHLLNDDHYGWGLVQPKRAAEIGLLPVKVRKTKNGYIIQRNLLIYPREQEQMRIGRISEYLSTEKKEYSYKELKEVTGEPWIERLLFRVKNSY